MKSRCSDEATCNLLLAAARDAAKRAAYARPASESRDACVRDGSVNVDDGRLVPALLERPGFESCGNRHTSNSLNKGWQNYRKEERMKKGSEADALGVYPTPLLKDGPMTDLAGLKLEPISQPNTVLSQTVLQYD